MEFVRRNAALITHYSSLFVAPRRVSAPLWYFMRTVFSLILFWALLLPSGQPVFAQGADASEQQARPVSEQELYMMLGAKGAFSARQIADIVEQRGIDFRLTDSTRKSLRKAGAGEAVMAALEKAYAEMKRRTTAQEAAAAKVALTAVSAPAAPPPPLDDQAAAELIEQARRNALQYSDRLPDFLCLQVIKRMYDVGGKGYWQTMDTIHSRVAYNEHHESYQVIMVNNTPVDRKLESMGGAVSTGEFGSMLRELFVPESRAEFRMVAPATLRGRPVYAYDYRVERENSKWSLYWEPGHAGEQHYVPGYHGRVIIDAQTHQVLRVWLVADDIPPDFPIHAAQTTLDYEWAKISDVPFLLPSRAIMEMKDNRVNTRNEIAFRGYRKFTTETILKFGDVPDEPPAQPEPAGQPTTPPGAAKQPPAGQQTPTKPPVKK